MQMRSIELTENLSTAEVAKLAGVHKDTLLRWLRSGAVPEPRRDRHGWRSFTKGDAKRISEFSQLPESVGKEVAQDHNASHRFASLAKLDWDFANAKTSYLTHGIHPYPAKFIPQIPNALIQELSSVGDTVGDIFCGSGTTLVEALTLKRNTVGVDANPLACLISSAKTTALTETDASLLAELRDRAKSLGSELSTFAASGKAFNSTAWRPNFEKLEFWFQLEAIEELAELKQYCMELPVGAARNLALVALSSIIVTVSRQDSDTRYVRREKGIVHGDTCRKFSRALENSLHVATEFTELVEPRFTCTLSSGSLLHSPTIPRMDLMVCSPPYPNAYSYHLYHMTRMLWLEMDQPLFKKEEIGSHRKYSSKSKNAATVETFRAEFTSILKWLSGNLKKNGYACFVVGDSTLRGERINNAELISAAGASAGFQEVARLQRTMQSSKKSFNPAIGKIKSEDILILENTEGQ
jgi:site-specific DNA-methyltransferase (cytosine-N4-specific)